MDKIELAKGIVYSKKGLLECTMGDGTIKWKAWYDGVSPSRRWYCDGTTGGAQNRSNAIIYDTKDQALKALEENILYWHEFYKDQINNRIVSSKEIIL